MTSRETIKTLENRYNVFIERNTFWNPLTRHERESFNVYSSDGCCWDKVIGYRSLIKALAEGKKFLTSLKPCKRYNGADADLWEIDW